VEVASSTNGQLTPPIMGAVAFLMVEYVGISYLEVIKHAALPALISYIALVYIVHLEALKANMQGLPKRPSTATATQKLTSFLATFLGLIVLTAIVYYGLGWMKDVFGDATPWIAAVLIIIAYVGLVKYAINFPELDTSMEIKELPETAPTVKAGLYYLLPVIVLVWCLTVERLSPGLSALYASVFRRHDRGLPKHDRHRRRDRCRRPRGRYYHADRCRPRYGRVRGVHFRRLRPADAALYRYPEPHPRHGLADDRELHRRLVADGPGHRHRRRAERPHRAPGRGAHVRLLLRHPCR
jgi:hypothetical protein